MNTGLLSFYSNIFGFVVGGISLLGFFVAFCRSHLPSNKIKTLVALLHETEDIFKESVEAGLLLHESIQRTEHRLNILKEHTHTLRARAYNVTTLYCDYVEFLRGTSNAIGRTCQHVIQLRAEVITSSEERRRLVDTNSEQAPAPPANHTIQHHPLPTPSALTRPHSCPPTLSASSDSSRCGSGVRRIDVQH